MRTFTLLLALALGCASSNELPPELAPLETQVEIHVPIAVDIAPPPITGLAACLQEGGRLIEVDAVDNDDTTEHGEVHAFDVAPDGRLAVATEDGVIKLWRLDGFLGALTPGLFAYGAELAATPSTDIAFFGDRVVAGDERGLVTAQSTDGLFEIMGGTTPDTPMVAVAVDATRERIAHADAAEGGNVHVRGSGTVVGPLDTGLLEARDLAFTDDGALLFAGQGFYARVQKWTDGEAPDAEWFGVGEVSELATAHDRIVAVGEGVMVVLDDRLEERVRITTHGHDARSVSFTPDAAVFLTVGDEGSLRAWSIAGDELGALAVPEPVAVRMQSDDLAFVASRDGMIRAIACE